VAERLGWRLVDEVLLREISHIANVPMSTVSFLDERVDPWLYRVVRPILGAGGDGISMVTPPEVFDADAMAQLTRQVIEGAYREGNCVIVGRGSQCILSGKADVFHVFAYARWTDRLHRVLARVPPGTDVSRLIRTVDEHRMAYVHRYYQQNRLDRLLYDLMVNTVSGCEAIARTILAAMEAAP
jgi:hypothetical protein